MRRSTWVLVGLGCLAIAEVAVLAAVGQRIGALPLVGILVAEALLGGWLVRHEGSKAWASLRAAQADPDRRGAALTDAALVLVGALLIMLPGFISDAVGALFLLPPTRGIAKAGVVGLFRSLTRKYRDQADLLATRVDRGSVVEGSVADASATDEAARRRPNETEVIKGEIEP